jgi:hypothetical protein
MLEKLGTTAADLGALVAKAQDALKGENDKASAEHGELMAALAGVIQCSVEHEKALLEAMRTHDLMVTSLKTFGGAADSYYAARIQRNSELIGEPELPVEEQQREAA